MGFFSKIFGTGNKRGFMDQPEIERQYRSGSAFGLGNRLGAQFQGYDKKGTPTFDWSGVGKSVGRDQSIAPYSADLGTMSEAISGFKNPYQFQETYSSGYTPVNYTFADPAMIDEITAKQYGLAAGDVTKAGQGALEKLRETVGTRRPGLLLQAGEQQGRDLAETLAKMRGGLDVEALGQKLALTKEQQLAQEQQALAKSAEGYKEYGSRADRERAQADENLRNLQSLFESAQGKVTTEQGLTQAERDYQDRALEMMMNMYMNQLSTRRGAGAEREKRPSLFDPGGFFSKK